MNTIDKLRALIEAEPDVKRVLELQPLADGRYRYLIETPFETFPRFVIGDCDASGNAVHHRVKCGREQSARDLWNDQPEAAS
jgi:hypothetical protein